MSVQKNLSASLIVLNWNGKQYLTQCLPSLFASDYTGYEVILVDNGSTDGSVEYVTTEFPRVRVIENGCNLGYAGGMNVGIAQTESDVVILLNNDIIVRRNWLSELMNAMAADERIGIAGCKVFFADGVTLQHAGGFITYPSVAPNHYGYRQPDTGDYDELADVDYVMGAAMAIRRQLLDEIGYLDADFFPIYFEDVDICYRARAAGWKVIYAPTSALTHLESATMVKNSYQYFVSMHRSRLRFALKHLDIQQFLEEFVPAEAAWLSRIKSNQQRRALCRAYKSAMLMAPAILGTKEGYTESTIRAVHQVTESLVGLHAKIWNRSGDL